MPPALTPAPPFSADPAALSPDDRARGVAALLAAAVLRLRPAPPTSEIPTDSCENDLAKGGDASVTVPAG